jgi:hypothetical protein
VAHPPTPRGLGRALRSQSGDQPTAAAQERLRDQAGRADRRGRPVPAGGDRRRPGRRLDERLAPANGGGCPVAAAPHPPGTCA